MASVENRSVSSAIALWVGRKILTDELLPILVPSEWFRRRIEHFPFSSLASRDDLVDSLIQASI